MSAILAKTVVRAPNLDQQPRVLRDAEYGKRVSALYAQEWRVEVGPPDASLAVAIIEPGYYHMVHKIVMKPNEKGWRWASQELDWLQPSADAVRPEPKATILLLHGYRDSKEDMLHWGLALAEQGYRCVLVDFRGHGQSTGDVISYGAFEARDLKRVLDDLQRRKRFDEQIGVVGVSYGASVGLLLASQDDRVKTVVALEPYSRAATGVVEFARGVAPKQTAKIADKTFQRGLTRAERLGGFQWKAADVVASMANLKGPVMLFHGAKDNWLSVENSRLLLEHAPGGSVLAVFENDTHLLLAMRLDSVLPMVVEWFQQHLERSP